ncbi:MAG: response regulator [Elusimicrobia bacterium]|nr:response regulator [Elusimicrobiota bacterium]MDE2510697.1 response regulator [Elusimicrobiota bacterium]
MRVLFAEDDPQLRTMLGRMLGALGHQAEGVRDGRELLRLAGSGGPDLVLSDIDMPGCDGILAGKILKRDRPGLAFLLMTGDPRSADAARAAGFHRILSKPFSMEELAAALASGPP